MSTVFDDVAFAPRNYGMSEAEVNEKTMEALKVVHIEQLKDKQIYKLSGGEKKLASIATILSTEPDVILMDEPSVALDPKNRRNLINILNQLNQAKIIASHDLNMIMDTCERTILLSDGKVIKDGNTKEILLDKELMEESGLELPLGY
jgi:cobalt/nickel transport system ATP-binding protein